MSDQEWWFLALGILSVVVFVGSLLSLPWLVSRIPADYFRNDTRTPAPWEGASPGYRLLILVLKNLLGLLLLAGGFIMLFIPGQGLLTLAMGLVLMDYPGKFRLERWLVSQGFILRGLNWLRRRRGCPPLETDASGEGDK